MKRTLLISVATIALVAGANLANAQRGDRGPMPQATPAETTSPSAAPTTADPANRAAREHAIPEKQTQAPPKATGTPQTTSEAQHKAPEHPQGTAERPMTSHNVSLSTEQKSTIRQKVLTSSAPRLSGHANFDIRVGVVVPREVRVAPLPAAILDIEPSWRGYMYFVSGDEIIVVEPGTLRIVAVLEV